MRTTLTLTAFASTLLLGAAALTPAAAADPAATASGPVCAQRIDATWQAWKASDIPTDQMRAGLAYGRNHDHAGMVTRYREGELAAARVLCAEGKDHEALLKIDHVRAWLKLPYEEHPASHNYHPNLAANG